MTQIRTMARELTAAEHNAVWAALTWLANRLDGKPCDLDGVMPILTSDGDESPLTADQVWEWRDSLADMRMAREVEPGTHMVAL